MRTEKMHNKERYNFYASQNITQLRLVTCATSSDNTFSHFARKPGNEGKHLEDLEIS
jgi:hypothetical protein